MIDSCMIPNVHYQRITWILLTCIPFINSSKTPTYEIETEEGVKNRRSTSKEASKKSTWISPCLNTGFNRFCWLEAFSNEFSRSSYKIQMTPNEKCTCNTKYLIRIIVKLASPQLTFLKNSGRYFLPWLCSIKLLDWNMRCEQFKTLP